LKLVAVCHATADGGAEQYLRTLGVGLESLGHEVELIGNVPRWDATGLAQVPVRLTRKWSARPYSPVTWPAVLFERRRVDAAAVSTGADVFHLQFKREQIGFTAALAKRAPVVWTEHGAFPRGALTGVLAAWYRRAAQHTEAIICVSDEVAAEIRGIVGPGPKLLVIPNGVDTTLLQPASDAERLAARERLGVPLDGRKLVAWVSRTDTGKLPLLAAQAGEQFAGYMIMAGGGSGDQRLRRLPADGKVRFIGFQDDVSTVLHAADAFLFTSNGLENGVPYSLREAAACGLPLVINAASKLGTALSAAGAFVGEDDPASLADAMTRACSNQTEVARAWAEANDSTVWLQRHAEVLSGAAVSNGEREP
jgi:glycosyltransferase involved in cell wall biosynthesis